MLWIIEEVLPRCKNGDPMFFSLHPLWHIFCALGLNMWTCVVKSLRGEFFGFDVEANTQDPPNPPIMWSFLVCLLLVSSFTLAHACLGEDGANSSGCVGGDGGGWGVRQACLVCVRAR